METNNFITETANILVTIIIEVLKNDKIIPFDDQKWTGWEYSWYGIKSKIFVEQRWDFINLAMEHDNIGDCKCDEGQLLITHKVVRKLIVMIPNLNRRFSFYLVIYG